MKLNPILTEDLRKLIENNSKKIEDIIESSTNYIKFADGTLVCFADVYATSSLSDYWNQLKRGQTAVTFPQEFVSTPLVNTGLKNAEMFAQLSVSADDIKVSGFTAKIFKPSGATSTGLNFNYIAVGNWK